MSTTSTSSQLHLPNSLISGISEMIGSALLAAAAPVAAPAFVRVGLRRGVEHVGEEEALRRDRRGSHGQLLLRRSPLGHRHLREKDVHIKNGKFRTSVGLALTLPKFNSFLASKTGF